MAVINPYLNFMGNTEEVFHFYRSVFGGEFVSLMRFKDMPGGDKMSSEDQEKIMHIALPIGNSNILMATDCLESMGQSLNMGNNFSINIGVDSKEEADKLFLGLAAGGQVNMPLETAFWGDYFGMLTDKWGVQWMISYSQAQQNQVGQTAEVAHITHG